MEFGLCTLLCNTSLRPYSVVLENVSNFEEWKLREGDSFSLSASQICSEKTPILLLDNAQKVNLKLDITQRLQGDIEEKMKIIAEAVYYGGSHQGLAPLLSSESFSIKENHYSSFLRPRIDAFCSAMRQDDLEQIRVCTTRIAGCGPGLTPSADDFICGFLSVWAACDEAGPKLAESKIKTVANEAALHTNTVSASFLRNSAQSLYSLDILEFVKTLLEEPDADDLRDACKKVMQFGAASGTDYLCGVYFALGELHTR